jgi:hypothetical protein
VALIDDIDADLAAMETGISHAANSRPARKPGPMTLPHG